MSWGCDGCKSDAVGLGFYLCQLIGHFPKRRIGVGVEDGKLGSAECNLGTAKALDRGGG